jgi:alkanesulfonate monooxygenase SsuD/methylene tetrahydromethanopterin reductase-like flavin-dependent oxidoreductase (luciferase family)
MIRFGVFDHLDDAGIPVGRQLAERLRLAELLDEAGFHAYHVAEHHGTPLGYAPSPSVFLAAVAQRTTRLRFGPLVYVLPLYHPLRLIEEICLLDQLSDGRLEVGVGHGASVVETALYDIDPETSRERFEETLEILLAGLTTDRLTHDGRFHRLDDVPMVLQPVQRPHPPLWYGINRPERAPWAAENAINVVGLAGAHVVRPVMDRYREAWSQLGRAPEALPFLGINRNVVLASEEAEAVRVARRAFAPWRRNLDILWDQRGVPSTLTGRLPHDFDEWRAKGFVYAGRPDGAREWVAAETEAAGVNYLCADLAFGDITLAEAARTVELLATEVMPHFGR